MILFKDLGISSYEKTWDLQKNLQSKRISNEINDTVLLVEHEPVYTFGKNANEDHLLQNYPDDVKVYHIERGGDITFHGPGQLVGYPIIDLHNYKKSVSWYMRTLESLIMDTLQEYEISSSRKEGLAGVWVNDKKIAALGVRMSRWVTMHGFALNVNTALHYYNGIIPCGIFEYGITSMENELGKELPMDEVKNVLMKHFRSTFQEEKN